MGVTAGEQWKPSYSFEWASWLWMLRTEWSMFLFFRVSLVRTAVALRMSGSVISAFRIFVLRKCTCACYNTAFVWAITWTLVACVFDESLCAKSKASKSTKKTEPAVYPSCSTSRAWRRELPLWASRAGHGTASTWAWRWKTLQIFASLMANYASCCLLGGFHHFLQGGFHIILCIWLSCWV